MEEYTLNLEDVLRAAAPEDKPAIEELIAMLNGRSAKNDK